MTIKTKDLLFFLVLSMIILVFLCSITYIFPKIYDKDIDYCLDTGMCKQGLEINTEYGKIKIDRDVCIKYHWIWIENAESCRIK